MIYFKLDVTRVMRNLLVIGNPSKLASQLYINGLLDAQRTIEANVISRLNNPLVKNYRNEIATDSKHTGVLTRIARNITSGYQTDASGIVLWTGKVRELDEKDPIFTVWPDTRGGIKSLASARRTINHPGVRLWRILEAGSRRHWILPKEGNRYLSFYFKRLGRNVALEKVDHPGTKGRSYFFKDRSFIKEKQIAYGQDLAALKQMKKAMAVYFDRFKHVS